jgi:hypothetical protein
LRFLDRAGRAAQTSGWTCLKLLFSGPGTKKAGLDRIFEMVKSIRL